MSTEQATEQQQTGPTPCLVLRGEDGRAYLIPEAALETFRLSDEQRAELDEQRPAADDDVKGHQYIGQFEQTSATAWGVWITMVPYRFQPDYHPIVR